MANEINDAVEAVTEAATSAKKTATRKATTAKKTATRKATTAKKTVARKATKAKKTATRKVKGKPAATDFAARAQEASRNAFLASLGFYGKAFDQVQDQFNNLQDQLEENRAKASDLYQELVKRGEKVEADAKNIELPELSFDKLADRSKLDAQLEKAKARFAELKESVSFKSAA